MYINLLLKRFVAFVILIDIGIVAFVLQKK